MTDTSRKPACSRSMDPELWFPVSRDEDTTVARAACLRCPVRWECGRYALETGQMDGIWAGYWVKYERAALARQLPEIAAPVPAGVCVDCGADYEPTGSDVGQCYGCVRGMVLAAPARTHVRQLQAAGLNYPQISARSGVPKGTLSSLMNKAKVTVYTARDTAEAIMAVPIPVGVS